MQVPSNLKIYHIVHVDRLPQIVKEGYLWCDAKISQAERSGTTIGLSDIKKRRLHELHFDSYPDLHPGDCVPFYFCSRSIMLYMISCQNHPDLTFRGGQSEIVHLEADLREAVRWANENELRWVFTLSNAGSYYFEDRCELDKLDEIDWEAVSALEWKDCKEGKQAEFLLEGRFPWDLISNIGVYSTTIHDRVDRILQTCQHRPQLNVRKDWYY